MRRIVGVLSVLLSFFCTAQALSAQDPGRDQSRPGAGFLLEQNFPNPFNPETTIPFTLSEELFVDGRPVVVSMRIFNLLQQAVGSPVALGHPNGEGVELVQLEYTQPGRYEAFWQGTDQAGRQVASGIYFLQITVNGESSVIRMIVQK